LGKTNVACKKKTKKEETIFQDVIICSGLRTAKKAKNYAKGLFKKR
jgi:hypothetical protein